jgi:2-keto-4-pentenoate hydratase/2-oxohepta-3-ene-1,7-dioic acid hydratase in catechol pathway
MRLVTFVPQAGGAPRIGLVRGEKEVVDLTRVAGKPPFDPADMISLIAAGAPALAWVRDQAAKGGEAAALDKVKLLAPIPRPRKNVFCVGWNYLEHFKEGEKVRAQKVELPEHPAFFTKTVTAVNGPFDPIPFDAKVSERIDWEVELALIIGPGGRNISEADAMKHVFGYAVLNDVTARDLQRRHGGQWFKGKTLDGSCPMGPWIVTADEVSDPNNLRLMTRVNGVVKQDSNTSYLYFKLPRIIAELSLGLTLEAGDIIATGTPAGVGNARTPPEFMKPGDVMETEIGGVGLLRNVIGG